MDGIDGSPGRPGSFTVTCDPAAQPYLALLHLNNRGGPKPILTQALVPPLW